MSSPTAGRQPLADQSSAKKIIVVVGANSPGVGLVSAICEDPKSGFAVRAIVGDVGSLDGRSLAELGIDLRAGDACDEASLRAGFAGAYGAFYIQQSSDKASAETKVATANAIARAAKEAGLRHVIWATLEDPGQALLQHDDLTPTLIEGRWVADEARRHDAEEIFAQLDVPTTFLQTSWDPSVAAGQWTEDIGRYAYTLFGGVESIGKTVAISAARLIRGVPAFPAQAARVPTRRAPAPDPSPAPAMATGLRRRSFAWPGPIADSAAQLRARKIAIAVAILAGAVSGLVLARQIVRPEGPAARSRLADSGGTVAVRPLPPPPAPMVTLIEAAPPPLPAPPLPNAPVDAPPARAPTPGYVDPRAVSAAVRAHVSEASACHDRAVLEHPKLHGRLTVRATIDATGRVLSLAPVSTIVDGRHLQTCLLAAFKRWKFPAPAGGVNGNISHVFSFESDVAR